MKPKKIHSRTEPGDVQYLTTDHKQVTADDEWFESVLRDWEHEGLDSDLIHMARPLLSGDDRQQTVANKFLSRVRDNYMDSTEAQIQLVSLLFREGVSMGDIPHASESELMSAWDEQSGGKGVSYENFSLKAPRGSDGGTPRVPGTDAPEPG